jgi:hypothetical protein
MIQTYLQQIFDKTERGDATATAMRQPVCRD